MAGNQLIPTKEFAKIVHVEGGTVRRAYCINGHYMGLKPVKLPNNRLLWSESDAMKLIDPAANVGTTQSEK